LISILVSSGDRDLGYNCDRGHIAPPVFVSI